MRRPGGAGLHPVAVHFKGSGFYTTDYGSKSKAKASGADGDSKSGGDESKSSGGESKVLRRRVEVRFGRRRGQSGEELQRRRLSRPE